MIIVTRKLPIVNPPALERALFGSLAARVFGDEIYVLFSIFLFIFMKFMTHLACLENVGDDLYVWTVAVARNGGVVAWVTTSDFASCFSYK